jgi:hypothetical protein
LGNHLPDGISPGLRGKSCLISRKSKARLLNKLFVSHNRAL